MLNDGYGGQHSSTDHAAVAAFAKAAVGVAAHRPGTGPALERALAHDPDLVAAHALKGLAAVILARDELLAPARVALAAAEAARARRGGGTAGEQALVAALAAAVEGRLRRAADVLEQRLGQAPLDLLAVKLVHSLRFMLGDSRGMLASTARVAPRWTAATPGCGYVLGCHAFALEEAGDLAAAERTGLLAVRHAPDDAWGLHAVAHVHEMQGRAEDGIAWLERARPVWASCNNFAFHIAWHLALFHLERGRHDRVLELYDREVRPCPTDDFRDVANAVSLLWRLEQEGVDVAHRWEELRGIARQRRRDTTLVFATLHYLMALVAAGDLAAARELAGASSARAGSGAGDQAGVAERVGLGLANAILGLAACGSAHGALGRLARVTPQLGGSHAQRDVFVRTLAMIAAEHGDRQALELILAQRARLKREDRFAALARARLDAAEALPRAS